MRFYVTGGRQKKLAHFKDEWHQHECGVIGLADLETGESRVLATYRTPPEACPPDDPAIQFKAGSLAGDELVVCTTTEILWYSRPNLEPAGRVSLHRFNDVHHVAPSPRGTWLVANTGLDEIVEVGRDGTVAGAWSAVDEDTWSRFDRDTDYRRVATTKPHAAHPNYVFSYLGEVWTTRFEQRDAVCLTGDHPSMPIQLQRPHDGCVHGEDVWFTTVDGRIVVTRPGLERPVRAWDLNDIFGGDRALGWCRGLHVLDDEKVVVGFTRLRPSRIRENLRWLEHRFGGRPTPGNLPTRISLVDLARGEVEAETVLETAGQNSVFSILPCSGEEPAP